MQDTGSCCNDDDDRENSTPDLLLRQEEQNLSSSSDAVKYDRGNDSVDIPSDRTMANNYDTYITVIKNNRFTSILLLLCLVLAVTLLAVVLQKNNSSQCAGSQVGILTQSASQLMSMQKANTIVDSSLASTSVKNSLPSTSDNSLLVDNDISSTSFQDSGSSGETVSHESNLKEIGYTMPQMPDTSNIKSTTTEASGILTVSTITNTVSTQTTSPPVNTTTSSTPLPTTNSSTKQQPDVYKLFKEDIDHLRENFSCKPRLVKLSIYQAINDPKNAILDKELYPDALSVMRCDHTNSFCCDTYGKETFNKSCTSTKNETKTHRAWYHEKNKFVYENITIREDLECKCI